MSRRSLISVGTGRFRPAGDKNAWQKISPMQLLPISINVKNSYLVHRVRPFSRGERGPQFPGPQFPQSRFMGQKDRGQVQGRAHSHRALSLQFLLSHSCLEAGAPNTTRRFVVNFMLNPRSGEHPSPILGPSGFLSHDSPSLDLLLGKQAIAPQCANPHPLPRSSTLAPTLPLVCKLTLSKNQFREMGVAAQPSWPHSAWSMRSSPPFPSLQAELYLTN